MAKKEIVLQPRFNSRGNVSGWEVTDGKNAALNRSKSDGEKAWRKSVTDYVDAGYTVVAKAYNSKGELDAHGTYTPSGGFTDHGPGPRKAPAKKPAAKKTTTRKRAPAKPAAKKTTRKAPAKKKPAAKKTTRKAPAKKPAAKKTAGKRKPSAYNNFVKRRLPQLKKQGFEPGEAMKICGAEWQKKKKK